MVSRRQVVAGSVIVALVWALPSAYMRWLGRDFPADTTPEGSYLRVVLAVSDGKPAGAFDYLETDAQHALFSLFDYGKRIVALVEGSYPEPEKGRLVALYRLGRDATGVPDLFAREAEARGWLARLRRDLSGIAHVEVQGDRATVETARGTRYPFRKRENGMWGLTLFTADLRAEAERAARDLSLVEKAAADYRAAGPPEGAGGEGGAGGGTR